jgi:hypothetical protein
MPASPAKLKPSATKVPAKAKTPPPPKLTKVEKQVAAYTKKNPQATPADTAAYTKAVAGGADNMTAIMAVGSARSLEEQRTYNDAATLASNKRLDDLEAKQNDRADQIWARQEQMFNDGNEKSQEQFDKGIAFQNDVLDRQLGMQVLLQKQSEEAALRAQVPTSTVDPARANARRVKGAGSGRQLGRQAAMGTSQLRIPLGIQQFMSSGGSPVKLNIGM